MKTYFHALIPELLNSEQSHSQWKDKVLEKYGFHRVIHQCDLMQNNLFGQKTIISFLLYEDDDLVSLRLRTGDLQVIDSVSGTMLQYYNDCREFNRPKINNTNGPLFQR